jgi:hypothetical protein
MIGGILIGLGIILLTTNRIGRRWDSPEAQRQTKWIALFLILMGIIIFVMRFMLMTRGWHGN